MGGPLVLRSNVEAMLGALPAIAPDGGKEVAASQIRKAIQPNARALVLALSRK